MVPLVHIKCAASRQNVPYANSVDNQLNVYLRSYVDGLASPRTDQGLHCFLTELQSICAFRKQSRPWSVCAKGMVDQGLHCLHMTEGTFCCDAAQICVYSEFHNFTCTKCILSTLKQEVYLLICGIFSFSGRRHVTDKQGIYNKLYQSSDQTSLKCSLGWAE